MSTIGSALAPSQNTVNYDALLTTTLDAYVGSGSLADNIFKESAFLTALRLNGGVQEQNGGERIRAPLMYGENSTVKSISGDEIIDTTQQDGITTAFYDWREIAGTISITRKEERQNSGEAQIIELLQSKVQQAEMTMREKVNTQLVQGTVSSSTFIPGNSSKDLNPLGWFFRKLNATDPTDADVGNIAGDTYSWWRHNTAICDTTTSDTGNAFAINVSSYAGMKVALRRMHNYCSRGGGGSPNLLVGDQISYETYENALDTQVRYTDTRMADLGFDSIKMKGATFIWDEVVPDMEAGATSITKGSVFFLNTKFYKLIIDSETNFVTTPFVEPENQNVKVAKILFMGNAVVNNMRKHGVCYALGQTITS